MRSIFVAAGTAAGCAVSAAVYVVQKRPDIRREAKSRWKAAEHVLRGKPLVYRMDLVQPPPPPLLHMAPGLTNALILESQFTGGGINFASPFGER